MDLKAIILAAGRGSRMGHLTGNQPKCRTELHGKSLIDWQLEALSNAGIEKIAIVTGYLSESFDFDVEYFNNSRWSETNMVLSLATAKSWLSKSVSLVSYSDIIYGSATVQKLIQATGEICITYDPNWQALWESRFEDPLSDAESFKLAGNRVMEIGNKCKDISDIEGQYMGLSKFSPKGWHAVESYLSNLPQIEQDKLDMTKLLQGLIANNVEVTAVAIDEPWYEVDSESDLSRYQELKTLF